ncbi:DNA polymerase III subunit delta' [Acidothermaceae bacterium B102]|nr:DNA polymerase III subunit delta' [Acidothermaceae bacterium B102]
MSVFDELVGQDDVIATLQQAVEAARGEHTHGFTHAWLFTGPPGSGRSVAARAFAAALQCPDGGCGHCSSCQTVRAGSHPDVDVVTPAGLSIGVAEARDIVLRSSMAPGRGGWQVVLLEDADRLTEAAANALLKAIEEPPPRGVFLLCVPSADDLPPTIRSRCRLVRLRTPSAAAVAAQLVSRDGVDSAIANFAARAAQGHVGRARRLATDDNARRQRHDALKVPLELSSIGACLDVADALVKASEEESARITTPASVAETAAMREAIGEGAGGKVKVRGTAGIMKDLERRQKSRETRSQRDVLDRALTDLAAFYRDVLLLQSGSTVPLVHGDLRDQLSRVAERSTPEATLRRVEAVLLCRERIAGNVAVLLAVEEMTLSLAAG